MKKIFNNKNKKLINNYLSKIKNKIVKNKIKKLIDRIKIKNN